MRFVATAEHSGGASASHPCRTGTWDDPADSFQIEVEAASLAVANTTARRELSKLIGTLPRCVCGRSKMVGSDLWWRSVSVLLWPQDAEALAAWVADGGDSTCDPYSLIPNELKEANCA